MGLGGKHLKGFYVIGWGKQHWNKIYKPSIA
jgi:hypothetical protein